MITPLLPMRLSGVLWYQGEANAGDPASYACRFPAMITDWRKHFGSIELPFFYVQLAAFHDDYSWIRAAQGAALDLEFVSVAVAIDLGDPTSPAGSIHSRRKQDVGRRLALDILKVIYDIGSGSGGPELVDVDIRKVSNELGLKDVSPRSLVQLQLGNTRVPVLAGTAACSECCYELPFETLNAVTGNWTRVAKAIVSGNSEILLESGSANNVVGVRYGWEGYPQCALYDTTRPHLPMAPFQWCRYGGELPPWAEDSCDVSRRQPTTESTALLRGS